MRRAVDLLIQLIQFAGVAVAFVGVVVAVVRVAFTSLAADRGRRITDIGLDLARTVLIGVDLLLVSAILEVAVAVGQVNFTRLATVAGLRIALSLLIAFELAFRADTPERPAGDVWSPKARPWETAIRRPFRPPARRPDARSSSKPGVRPGGPPAGIPSGAADRSAENLWPRRARLGRD